MAGPEDSNDLSAYMPLQEAKDVTAAENHATTLATLDPDATAAAAATPSLLTAASAELTNDTSPTRSNEDARDKTPDSPPLPPPITRTLRRRSSKIPLLTKAKSLSAVKTTSSPATTQRSTLLPSQPQPWKSSSARISRPRSNSETSIEAEMELRTASQVPMPKSGQAGIVEWRSVRSSQSSTTQPSEMLRFGSRRIGSPEALKVLDQGRLRRQLQRINTNTSTISGSTTPEHTFTSDSEIPAMPTPSLYSDWGTSPEPMSPEPTSPEFTTAVSSPTEPVEQVRPPISRFALPEHAWNSSEPASLSEDDTTAARHISTEPFPPYREDARKVCRYGRSLEDIDTSFIQSSRTTTSKTLRSSRSIATQLPTIRSQAALPVQNEGNTNEELSRTLSHLEGKGTPPTLEVQPHNLREMYEEMRRNQEARGEKHPEIDDSDEASTVAVDTTTSAHAPGTPYISKWSSSTPSGPLTSHPVQPSRPAVPSFARTTAAVEARCAMASARTVSTLRDRGRSAILQKAKERARNLLPRKKNSSGALTAPVVRSTRGDPAGIEQKPSAPAVGPLGNISLAGDVERMSGVAKRLANDARMETDPHRRERQLVAAKALLDALTGVREAAISAEKAEAAAREARQHLEIVLEAAKVVSRVVGGVP